MLAIRMQRTGRKKQAQFRVIVQDSHASPSSGKVVAYLGSYNPHTKVAALDKEAAQKYLDNGAQPSDRVARLFKNEKLNLPKWVKIEDTQSRKIRNPEKLRKNQPAEEAPAEEAPTEEPASEEAAPEAEAAEEKPAEEESKEEAKPEEKAEDKSEEKPEGESDEKPEENSEESK